MKKKMKKKKKQKTKTIALMQPKSVEFIAKPLGMCFVYCVIEGLVSRFFLTSLKPLNCQSVFVAIIPAECLIRLPAALFRPK